MILTRKSSNIAGNAISNTAGRAYMICEKDTNILRRLLTLGVKI